MSANAENRTPDYDEREARRERSRAAVEAARLKDRAAKIDLITDILKDEYPAYAGAIARMVFDGLHDRRYFLIHFDPTGWGEDDEESQGVHNDRIEDKPGGTT